jgi:hypothetical protein
MQSWELCADRTVAVAAQNTKMMVTTLEKLPLLDANHFEARIVSSDESSTKLECDGP